MPIVKRGLVMFEDDMCFCQCYHYEVLVKNPYCKKFNMYLEQSGDRFLRCLHCVAEHGFRNEAESQVIVDPEVVSERYVTVLNLT